MLPLRFPYTAYGKESSLSRPRGPTLRSRSGARSNEGSSPPSSAELRLRPGSMHSTLVGQALGLQLRTFCSDSHQGSVPRLFCLLVTGGPYSNKSSHTSWFIPSRKKKEKREMNALSQHGMQTIPVGMTGSTQSCACS